MGMERREVGILNGKVTEYIDLVQIGSTVGIPDANGRPQTGIEIINIIEQCGNIIGMIYGESSLEFRFDSGVVLRVYGKEALNYFGKLINSYPELNDRLKKQVNKLNIKDTKNNLRETGKRVRRKNKYARRRARAGIAIICTIAFGVSTVSFFTKHRSESDTSNTDITTTEGYELPSNNMSGDIVAPTIPELEGDSNYIKLDYEDLSYESKAVLCKENYYNKIVEYATTYGIDPQIMLGIATQERGTHSNVIDDSGAIGLMQLEVGVWGEYSDNGCLSAYNYKEGRRETLSLPLQDMGDLDNNIKYACMIFQNCMSDMDDNVIAAIQEYNFGYGNMEKVFLNYQASTGISMNDALKDYKNLEWLKFRSYSTSEGDPNYVENVLGWLGNKISFKVATNDGLEKEIVVKAKASSKAL